MQNNNFNGNQFQNGNNGFNNYGPNSNSYFSPNESYYNPNLNSGYGGQMPPNPENFEFYTKKQQVKKEIFKIGLWLGAAILGYLIIQVITSSVLQISGLTSQYKSNCLVFNAFNMIGISFCALIIPFGIMAACNKQKYHSALVPRSPVPFRTSVLWICVGMLWCECANYLVALLILFCKSCGYELNGSSDTPLPNSIFACIVTFLGTAVFPAVCEELAMRCFGLGLLKNYGKAFGVLAISIVFGLIHANIVQFIFAFIVGLFLAFITIKTDSVLPAMFIHCFNNGMSAIQDITKYATNSDDMESKVSFLIFAIWIAAGLVSLVILKREGKLNLNELKEEKQPWMPNFGTKFAMLLPGLAIPLLILIVLTISTIKKI